MLFALREGLSPGTAETRLGKAKARRDRHTETREAAAQTLASIAPDVSTQVLLLELLEAVLRTPADENTHWRSNTLAGGLAQALSSIRGAPPLVSTRIHQLLEDVIPHRSFDFYRHPFDDGFPQPVPPFVDLVETYAPTPEIAVELLARLYQVGHRRMIDHEARSSPLDALARIGAAAMEVLVEVADQGDTYAFWALGGLAVDRDFAIATIRRILSERPNESGKHSRAEMAARMLQKLQPPDVLLLQELTRHSNEAVRTAAEASLQSLQDHAASQQPGQMRVIQPTEVPLGAWRDLSVIVSTRDTEGLVRDVISRRLRQAKAQLRSSRVAEFRAGSAAALIIVPVIPGFEVNPRQVTFNSSEPIHEFEFRVRSLPEAGGAEPDVSANGKVSLFYGPLIVAEIPVSYSRILSSTNLAIMASLKPVPGRLKQYLCLTLAEMLI